MTVHELSSFSENAFTPNVNYFSVLFLSKVTSMISQFRDCSRITLACTCGFVPSQVFAVLILLTKWRALDEGRHPAQNIPMLRILKARTEKRGGYSARRPGQKRKAWKWAAGNISVTTPRLRAHFRYGISCMRGADRNAERTDKTGVKKNGNKTYFR